MLRIRSVEPLDGHCVRLTLTDGSLVDRDIDDLLRGPVFEPIRSDEAVFRRVRVRRGTIVWPGSIDIDPDVLIWGGPAPADGHTPPPTLKVAIPA
jgi:hypothetical protein